MQNTFRIDQIIEILKKDTKKSPEPMTREIIFLYGKSPYHILISCLLSLQARDVVTLPVSIELFKLAQTPQEMVALSFSQIEQTIKSINYFKTKAKRLHSVSQDLLDRFDGKVPADLFLLRSIKGIGLKTANLVLAEAFDIPAICVDTHVHRLSNHWGMVATKTPEQTEAALKKILPEKYWIEWNYLLVKWGQSICKSKRCDLEQCREISEIVKNKV
ncbi:MAG: endonuclease III [Candidatus Babeliales bacterium]|jgi:endonuclease-3